MKRSAGEERAFIRGMALALAEVNGQWDEPTMVGQVLRDAGLLSLKQLRKAGVEEFDIDRLRSAMREAQKPAARRARDLR